MKKTSTIVKETNNYEIDILINNTAYIKSVTGKTGLLNIKTNQIIGEMDNYYTIYDTEGKFYYQEKQIEKSSQANRWDPKNTVRIYDALNEKMLVDGWEVIQKFKEHYDLTTVKSPIDGKIHIFDRYNCRKPTDIFDMAFDDVELLYGYGQYSNMYLVVTLNGKKGLYHHTCYGKIPSQITPIEFDNIEKFPNIIVYTKNNQKYFIYDGKDDKMSLEFDDIVLDEQHKNIVYCKKGNRIYVYNTKSQELLLNEECDDIKYLCFEGEVICDHRYGKFYFTVTKESLKGLLVAETVYGNREINTSNTSLLSENYDDIEYSYGVFYTKKDGKTGLFKQCYEQNVLVEADYDKITSLGRNMYAFYYDDRCDVYKIENSLDLLIKNCKLISSQKYGYIFKQKNLYGILYQALNGSYHSDVDAIVNNYDNVSYLGNGYYEVEKNGKKGVNFRSQDIIPMEYDTIDLKLYHKKINNETVYFALGKKDLGFELAKKRHWESSNSAVEAVEAVEFADVQKFEEINFFEDIMALRTKTNLLIYDYEEKLLKNLPVSSQISMIYRNPDNRYNKKPIYVIDGKFYYYKNGKFEEVYIENNDFYLTTYESDTNSFEVRAYNKDEHDSFCSVIDSKEDSEAEKTLIEMSEKGFSRHEYPTLVLKRINKRNHK